MPKLAAAALAFALVATSAAGAPRPTGEAKLQKMLEGYAASTPTNCVSLSPSSESTKIEGVGIVYKRGRTLYVNRFVNGCPSLDTWTSVVTRTPSTQLCRGDIARIVDFQSKIEGGSCVLGDFTPYERVK